MKSKVFIVGCSLVFSCYGEDKIPSKSEFDAIMQNAVLQMNAQMAGTKIDDYTEFKFVTYDKNPPLFSYFYSSNALTLLKQGSLNETQNKAMKTYNLQKTCSSKFRPLMKPYNLRVAHIFEDKITGKTVYKLTVSHDDC